MMRYLALPLAVFALAACGEKPQTQGSVKSDANAYSGTGSQFVEPGWKQGDKDSWEKQLRARTQNTQNEYNRVN